MYVHILTYTLKKEMLAQISNNNHTHSHSLL